MPLNKEAYIRYRIIDACIRNRQKPFPTMYDLMEALERKLGKEISQSTIQKDIKSMKEDAALGYRAPIVFNRQFNGYAYSDPNYSISDFPLTQQDLPSLEFATALLEQFEGIELLAEFKSAVQKIFDAIEISSALSLEERTDFIELEKQPEYRGSQWLKTVIHAIQDKRRLRFDHQGFDRAESKRRVLEPYLLKQYHQRWYLIGRENGQIKTFGLDRIKNLEKTEERFAPDPDFNAQQYFRHTYGITSYSGVAEQIELLFQPLTGQYIKSVPLHSSQEILEDSEARLRIRLELGITIELIQAILRYGPAVKVLKPARLREAIRQELEKAIGQYGSE